MKPFELANYESIGNIIISLGDDWFGFLCDAHQLSRPPGAFGRGPHPQNAISLDQHRLFASALCLYAGLHGHECTSCAPAIDNTPSLALLGAVTELYHCTLMGTTPGCKGNQVGKVAAI
jgi:hypothetical protein